MTTLNEINNAEYDSPYVFHEEVEVGTEGDVRDENHVIDALSDCQPGDVRNVEERPLSGSSLVVDDEDESIMESIANTVEGCCLF